MNHARNVLQLFYQAVPFSVIILTVYFLYNSFSFELYSQAAITCSKLTTETLEQGMKYVQS